MYAIVSTGGKQYKVHADDVIAVEKLDGEPGTKVELPVLFLSNGEKIVADPSALEGKKVEAEVVEQFRGQKQIVFKFKRRKRYQRTQGHRQNLTRIKVTALPDAE